MTDPILPCPFCGGTEVLWVLGGRPECGACIRCSAFGPDPRQDESNIQAWNRRHNAKLDALRAELAGVRKELEQRKAELSSYRYRCPHCEEVLGNCAERHNAPCTDTDAKLREENERLKGQLDSWTERRIGEAEQIEKLRESVRVLREAAEKAEDAIHDALGTDEMSAVGETRLDDALRQIRAALKATKEDAPTEGAKEEK